MVLFRLHNWVSLKLQRVWLIKQNTSSPHSLLGNICIPSMYHDIIPEQSFSPERYAHPGEMPWPFPRSLNVQLCSGSPGRLRRQLILSRGHCELGDVTASVRDLLRLKWEKVRLQLPCFLLFPFLVLYHFGSFELYMAFYLSQSFAGSKTRTFPVFPLTVIRIWLSKLGLP